MSAPLVERLREALPSHTPYYGNQPSGGHWFVLGCNCGARWTGPPSEFNAHLVRVTARVVEAWLGEQRETVAEAIDGEDNRWQHGVGASGYDPNGAPLWLADAALDALRAQVGADR
jgi:hypothetical protein